MTTRPPCLDQASCADELVKLLPSLRARALTMTRNRPDAEDLVQATAAQVLHHWRRFEPGTNFRAWVQRILLNLYIEGLRRKSRESSLDKIDVDTLAAPVVEPQEQWRAFGLEDMRAALPHIAAPLRGVLDAHLSGQTNYQVLGRQFGIPTATVATRIYRGRQKLRRVLLASAGAVEAAS